MMPEAEGLERAAIAMLRVLGGGKASLLLPQPATVNQQTGLGLTAPLVNEVEIEPVLLQAAPNGENSSGQNLLALMTRRTAEKAITGAGGLDTTATLEASMLRAGRTEYRIISVTVKWFGGAELMYELGIEA